MILHRPSKQRGFADHGWLRSAHTFSFASYYDTRFMGFGDLRVINEDYIEPGAGFPTHAHADMEIITYVVEGSLAHKDSMGTSAAILPGEVQRMSAGTGVRHSEYNAAQDEWTHLLQIWILPAKKGVEPSYEQRSFAERLQKEGWVLTVSPDGKDGSLKMNQDANLYVGRWAQGHEMQLTLSPQRHYWVQVVKGEAQVNGYDLGPGDGLGLAEEWKFDLEASPETELLFFDLP